MSSLLGLLAFGFAAVATAQSALPVTPRGLWVEGTSNLHDFTCEAGALDVDTAMTVDDGPDAFAHVAIRVPVEVLHCGSDEMDSRMSQALKGEANPVIAYTAVKAALLERAKDGRPTKLRSEGQLTIAGVTRPVTLEVALRAEGGKRWRVTGQVPIKMTDFGVKPPRALGGLLRTADDVTVKFDVSIELGRGSTRTMLGRNR